MKYRTFGRSGLRVSELFLGSMTFGENWGWGASQDECRKIVQTYLEAGGNVIDTASGYTDGASEQIVGELIHGERDRFVLSTKYSLTIDGADPNAAGNHRKSLRRSLEQSLTRLGTDWIDVLWVHIWDARTPIEETMRALDDAVRAGKVLYVGISDAPAWVIARANTLAELRGWSSFIGLQLPYSLTQRDIEQELLPPADSFGLSTAAWSPLAAGLLTGKFTRGAQDGPSRVDRAQLTERDLRIAATVDRVADQLGASSSQVALAWTRAHSRAVHPILGARTAAQLADNLAAADLVLPGELVDELDAASGIDPTFPYDFIASTAEFVYGPVGASVQP